MATVTIVAIDETSSTLFGHIVEQYFERGFEFWMQPSAIAVDREIHWCVIMRKIDTQEVE